MTREEEMAKVSREEKTLGEMMAFRKGVEWADRHPRWISVKDELPKRDALCPNQSVFVLTFGLRTIVAFYNYDDGKWVWNTDVTHWMPLPSVEHLKEKE